MREIPAVRGEVTPEALARVLGPRLPDALLRDDVPFGPEPIFLELSSRVMGQDAACRAVAASVATLKAGLANPDRPVALFLFAGPTGVGKTTLARTLADLLFGHGDEIARRLRSPDSWLPTRVSPMRRSVSIARRARFGSHDASRP